MAKVSYLIVFGMLLALCSGAFAGNYTLTDGQSLTGEPVSYDKNGVVLKLPNGTFAPRTPWNKFSQESLRELAAEAKRPQEAEFIEPFFEQNIQEEVERQVIDIKAPTRVDRPEGGKGIFAGLSSPLWLAIMLILYAGNIYGGYAVGQFKNMPAAIGCGVAAVVPFIGPIILLFVRPRLDFIERQQADHAAEEAAAATAAATEETAAQEQTIETPQPVDEAPQMHQPAMPTSAAPSRAPKPEVQFSLPPKPVSVPAPAQPTVTFRRAEFTFNRRFFETRMPGFFRVVPSEEEKELVLAVKSLRGDFVAKRIPKITQTDIHLETFKGEATAEEIIPFVEIQEVQIRHKDAV